MGICISKPKIQNFESIGLVIRKKVPKLYNLNRNSLFRKRRTQRLSMSVPNFPIE